MSVKGLQKLEVWRRAKDFALRIYREVIPLLPAEEKWGLAQQLRRSSESISANLAEGYGRRYYQDNIRFYYNARGSLEETLSHLVFVYEVGYLPANLYQSFEQEGEELTRMINGYIAYLSRSKQANSSERGADHSISDMPGLYFLREEFGRS
jgi:four helix bundle protein